MEEIKLKLRDLLDTKQEPEFLKDLADLEHYIEELRIEAKENYEKGGVDLDDYKAMGDEALARGGL